MMNTSNITLEKAEHLITLFTEELGVLQEFGKEKDERKTQIFRYSISLFSIFSTAVLGVFALLSRTSSTVAPQVLEWLPPLFSVILVGIGIINFILIKHYSEAHVGRIIAAQQANLLRRSQSSIIYFLIEDRLPDNNNSLQDRKTNYWKYFGRAQSGDIDNRGLIERESSAFFTSAGITMLTMLLMSVAALLLPVVYHLSQSQSPTLAAVSGAISAMVFLAGLLQIYLSHQGLLRKLREHEALSNAA